MKQRVRFVPALLKWEKLFVAALGVGEGDRRWMHWKGGVSRYLSAQGWRGGEGGLMLIVQWKMENALD